MAGVNDAGQPVDETELRGIWRRLFTAAGTITRST
jgi:hypothetical protein